MSRKTTLTGSTALPTPATAKHGAYAKAIGLIGAEAVKSDAAIKAAEKVLPASLIDWLGSQSEEARAEIFVAIEATLTPANCRKLAIHPARPAIDASAVEVERERLANAAAQKRQERAREREAAERAEYEALKAKFEGPARKELTEAGA